MVDAKDLRIGNWLRHKISDDIKPERRGTDFEVTADDILACTEGFAGIAEPIPLTEDWLVKLGFDKKEDNVCIVDDYVDSFCLDDWGGFYKQKDYYLPNPYYFDHAFSEDFKLRYAHQLQNLYFALTGKELETK